MTIVQEKTERIAAATTECVIYVRLSQDQRADEAGVDRQLDECREWARNKGWTVREVYVDNDKSATKEGVVRDDFERLLVDLATDPCAILCWHSDRFIRTVRDLDRVIRLKVNVHAIYAGHFDLTTPAGRAVATTITAWAAYEGEQKAERQKSAHRQRIAQGRAFWPRRPYGFNMDGTERTDEAEVLREMYSRVLAGDSLLGTCEWANARGHRTVAGREWCSSSLRDILRNPRNIGRICYLGEEVGDGAWKGIVDEGQFRAVERILADPTRRSGGPRGGRGVVNAFLATIVECGLCGEKGRTLHRSSVTLGRVRLYGCRLGHASARADWLEDHAAALITQRFLAPVDQMGNEPADVEAMRAELETSRFKADELAEMFSEGELSRDQFKNLNAKTQARIKELERDVALAGLDETLHTLLDVDDLENHFEQVMTVREKHAVARRYFDRIVLIPRDKTENARQNATGKPLEGKAQFWVRGETEPRCTYAV